VAVAREQLAVMPGPTLARVVLAFCRTSLVVQERPIAVAVAVVVRTSRTVAVALLVLEVLAVGALELREQR
jgi:hypothetical protein